MLAEITECKRIVRDGTEQRRRMEVAVEELDRRHTEDGERVRSMLETVVQVSLHPSRAGAGKRAGRVGNGRQGFRTTASMMTAAAGGDGAAADS